jgi:hypothetical protein
MRDQMNIGDFGYFEFTISKKAKKYGEYETAIKGHYQIKELEDKNVLLTDGDKELIVTRRRITKFEKKKLSLAI